MLLLRGYAHKGMGGQELRTGISRRSYSRQAAILFLALPAIKTMDVKKPQLSGAVSADAARVLSTCGEPYTRYLLFVNYQFLAHNFQMDEKTKAVLRELIESNLWLTRAVTTLATHNQEEIDENFEKYMLINAEAIEKAARILHDIPDTD